MFNNKKIMLMLPALNEEASIGQVIERVPEFVDEIIVIDDGSTDQTTTIARSMGARVISHAKNLGVGATFQTGLKTFLKSDCDILINMDSDGQFQPEDIEKLVKPISAGNLDFVSASRFRDKDLIPEMTTIKFRGNQFMAWFISNIIGQRFYDVSCGFRAYNKETAQRLNLFGKFTYTQETFIDLAFKGLRMGEVPVKVRGIREHGKSRVASNLWRYGRATLSIIIFSLRDYRPLKLFGLVAFIAFIIGFGLLLFLLIHYLQTGAFSPHKWAGFTGGFMVMMSIIFLFVGFILDMFTRMRMNQENILFELRRRQ